MKGSGNVGLIPRNFFFDDDFDNYFLAPAKKNDLKCDIYEKNNNYFIEMDVAGFEKPDINVELKDGYLTIKATKSNEDKEQNKNYIRRERSYGEYQRTFSLGDVDDESIEAKIENGTLLISIPKKEKIDNTKSIEIK